MATAPRPYDYPTLRVIHPLDDVAEQKCTSEGLGPIEMTRPSAARSRCYGSISPA